MLRSRNKKIKIRWISKKYGNFVQGKIYDAEAMSVYVYKRDYTHFRIEDEDGDYYTLYEKERGKLYIVIEE